MFAQKLHAMPLRAQRKFVPKGEEEGERGREREKRGRLSIFRKNDPLWLIEQVQKIVQTGARKTRYIYTNSLFNSMFHTDVIKGLCTS